MADKISHDRDGDDDQVVWGAGPIGKEIDRTRSQTSYMLTKGMIKAARRTGGLWHANRRGLRAQFKPSLEEGAA